MDLGVILNVAAASFILFSSVSVTDAALPNGECSVEELTCQLENNNVIGIISGILTAEECKQECQDNSNDCKIYSYYGQGGIPFVGTCILFNDCSILEPVVDCYTEDIECFGLFCNATVEGRLGENLIDFVADVTMTECENECEVKEQCQFFTYHQANSTVYPGTCFLLTKLQEPIIPCENGTCVSGIPNCRENLCTFLDGGFFRPNGIVVTETREIDFLAIGECPIVLAVAVGGGGNTTANAGSGSGYVEFQELRVSQPYMRFEARVGSAAEASEVTDKSDGSSVTRALPGGNGGSSYSDGAPGYSGGGASDYNVRGGDGGSDGTDGDDTGSNDGGRGSGFDISIIPLKFFELR